MPPCALGIAIFSPKLPFAPLRPTPASRCLPSSSDSESPPSTAEKVAAAAGKSELQIGSPIVVVEAPVTFKTADSMPSLRVNSGHIKPGDVGRILARKPKDVWAVRLAGGAYLLDGKHFKPLELDE